MTLPEQILMLYLKVKEMKLIYKGIYKNADQLPKGDLPPDAVKFREPKTPLQLNIVATLFMLPVALLIGLFILLSYLIYGQIHFQNNSLYFIIGMVLSLATIFPHELLHAVCFGKNAEVQLFVSIKMLMAFVVSTQPVSKRRFIFLSLLPNLVFGWIPLLLWAVLPYHEVVSNLLFSFSALCTFLGAGDYLNVVNGLIQMPKGSIQQMSGFNSYWYTG